ncbi:MAG: glycosyltransferase [Alphaproteobacteria bacterium]|nr:glycosyltransferase [Alphaproteobacteria bacterium]
MKILQVMAGAPQGGAETAFEDMCLALESAKDTLGLTQKIVVRGNNPDRVARLRAAGIEVFTLPFGGPIDLYTPWAMKQMIARYRPQIVQTWMARAAAKTPADKIPGSSAPKSYLKVSRLGGYYNLKYFKTSDYFITITPDIAQYLENNGQNNGIEREKIRHINNFAESNDGEGILQNTPEITRAEFRAQLQTPPYAPVIVALSRYHRVKGLDVLIRAIVDIPAVHLWLAGEGQERKNLEDLAAALNVKNRTHFLGWRNDRAALLGAADICAFPSRYEPFGTTFVQAWAHKTPLITSNAQGPKQYVRDHEDGLMFEVDNIEQLNRAINELIGDEDLRQRLVAAGFNRYRQEFSRDEIVKQYINFYREILAKNNIAETDTLSGTYHV